MNNSSDRSSDEFVFVTRCPFALHRLGKIVLLTSGHQAAHSSCEAVALACGEQGSAGDWSSSNPYVAAGDTRAFALQDWCARLNDDFCHPSCTGTLQFAVAFPGITNSGKGIVTVVHKVRNSHALLPRGHG
eukprot:113193-Pyramimonas_sp.AAC.1